RDCKKAGGSRCHADCSVDEAAGFVGPATKPAASSTEQRGSRFPTPEGYNHAVGAPRAPEEAMNTFVDRVVLITGAGSGIGRQFALSLAAEGARVAALDRNAAALEALEADIKGRPFARAVADVTDASAVASAVADLEARLGPT